MIQLLMEVVSKSGEPATRSSPTPSSDPAAHATSPEPDTPISFWHVDARFSDGISEIGKFQLRKMFLVFGYVFQAWWHRIRHGADCFYFMPANGARVPIYRDWIILSLCRPFFRITIFHWQALGLGEWLEKEAKPWERWISLKIYGRPDLSIILRAANTHDAEVVRSRRVVVVPNAIEDPCLDFETNQLPRHQARQRIRQRILKGQSPEAADESIAIAGQDAATFKILYIGLCHSEKGLFDAVEGVRLAGQRLLELFGTGAGATDSPLRIQLTVAGKFWSEAEQRRFEELIKHPDLSPNGPAQVVYAGYAGGETKWRLFRESDCLIFPTYYSAESFGIVLVEGMAFGLALIASRWRGLDDLLPEGYPGAVDPKQPEQIADSILAWLSRDYDPSIRQHFLKEYTAEVYARKMKKALKET